MDRASRSGLRLPFQVLQDLEGWDKGVLAEHIKLTSLTRTSDIVGYFRGDYNDLNFFAYGCGNVKNGLFPRLRTLRLLVHGTWVAGCRLLMRCRAGAVSSLTTRSTGRTRKKR